MIKITKKEDSSCNNCMSANYETTFFKKVDDIYELNFSYNNSGISITLCKECVQELKNILNEV